MDTVSFDGLAQAVSLTLNASGGGIATSGLNGDTLLGGFENVVGTSQGDTITGNAGDNILIGLGGNDTLVGGDGNDKLYGGDGSDILRAGGGADVLNGGAGKDFLYGSSAGGIDSYVYQSPTDSTPGAPDQIFADLAKIDLSQIDANGISTDGDQPFLLVSDFTEERGQLVIMRNSFDIVADIDGDGAPDMLIRNMSQGLVNFVL